MEIFLFLLFLPFDTPGQTFLSPREGGTRRSRLINLERLFLGAPPQFRDAFLLSEFEYLIGD